LDNLQPSVVFETCQLCYLDQDLKVG